MQCPACQFFNTLGAAGCVRCGTRLDLAGVAIDPPRASSIALVRTAKSVRVRAGIVWRDAIGDGAARICGAMRIDDADWRLGVAIAASIIPGLGQMRQGQRGLGCVILGVWFGLAAVALFAMGTDWNWIAVMCMLGTHSISVNLLLGPYLRRRPPLARAAVGLLVYLVLLCGIYWPARVASGQLVFTLPVGQFQASSRVQPQDVLLCAGPWLNGREWKTGEIVMHSFRAVNGTTGVVVDRIIGGPGDVLTVEGGRVTVNGQVPLPFLAPLRAPDSRLNLTISCPEGHVIIFPSLLRWLNAGQPQAMQAMSRLATEASIVPTSQIQARVLARVRPLTRFGLID